MIFSHRYFNPMIEAPFSELDYSSDYLEEFHGFTDEDDKEGFNERIEGGLPPVDSENEQTGAFSNPKRFKEDDGDQDIVMGGAGEMDEDETMKFTREE